MVCMGQRNLKTCTGKVERLGSIFHDLGAKWVTSCKIFTGASGFSGRGIAAEKDGVPVLPAGPISDIR